MYGQDNCLEAAVTSFDWWVGLEINFSCSGDKCAFNGTE